MTSDRMTIQWENEKPGGVGKNANYADAYVETASSVFFYKSEIY
jgi:hypothetical protein